jgi:hypothetical protein
MSSSESAARLTPPPASAVSGTASPERSRPASTLTARNMRREYAFWPREADFMVVMIRDAP